CLVGVRRLAKFSAWHGFEARASISPRFNFWPLYCANFSNSHSWILFALITVGASAQLLGLGLYFPFIPTKTNNAPTNGSATAGDVLAATFILH
ncbi:MAG: hypothetical protein ACXW0L_06125, partial [Methylosarcina sp.]